MTRPDTSISSRDALLRALAFVVPYWKRLGMVLVISVAGTLLSLYLPLLSRDLVDDALIDRNASSLVRIVAVFVAVTLVSFGLNVVSGLRYTRVSADILFDMRLAMFRHLQRLSPRFYARTRLGDIMSRINNDIGEIQQVAAEAALAWVGNVLFLAGAVVALAWLDLRLFLVGIVAMPISLWALVRYRQHLEGRVAELRDRSADIGSFLIESIQAMRLVVTSNAHARETEKFRNRNEAFVRALMSMQTMTYLSGGLPGLILSGGMAVVFLYGGHRVIDGSMTAGTLVAFMAYQMRLLAPVQELMGLYTSIASARVSMARVCEILDTPPEVIETADAVALPASRGAIAFDGVSFAHDRDQQTVDNLSFTASAGDIVAIVGPSGSGKSTIADLLVRLVDPDAGSVRLDGHDLRSLRLDDVRRHIVVVDQTPVILHASIADNLRYAKTDATDEELADAVHAAGLDAFLARLPRGYQTIVGERGSALSAGERQRLAIARALLADPAVLVLDEPTAALDPAAERDVVEGYEAAMRGRTTILITHRPEPARRAHRIVVVSHERDGEARRQDADTATAFAEFFQVPQSVV